MMHLLKSGRDSSVVIFMNDMLFLSIKERVLLQFCDCVQSSTGKQRAGKG